MLDFGESKKGALLTLKLTGLDETVTAYAGTEKFMKRVINSSLRATGRRVEREVEKDIIRQTKVPAKLVRTWRVKFSRRLIKRDVALTWVGFKNVKPRQLGKLSQNRTGARAGRVNFPGGFIATVEAGNNGAQKTSIWKREGAKRYMEKGNYIGQLRQPIKEQKLSITQQAIAAAQRVQPQAGEWFREEFGKRFAQKTGIPND